MAQLKQHQIKNNVLSGASIVRDMEVYDETEALFTGVVRFWQGKVWETRTNIAARVEGDLSAAPHLINDWKEVLGFLGVSSDYDQTEDWVFLYMDLKLSSDITITMPGGGWKEGEIKFFNSFWGSGINTATLKLNGNTIDTSTDDIVIHAGGYLELLFTCGEWRMIRSRNISNPFKPSDIPNLEFWIDANDTSSFTTTGSVITSVTEKSTNSYATSSIMGTVTLESNVVNGQDVMRFSGTNNNLNFGNINLHDNSATRGIHIYAVTNTLAMNDTIISKYDTAGDNRCWRLRTNRQEIFENGSGAGNEATTYVNSIGSWMVLSTRWETLSNSKTYINGGLRQVSSNTVDDILNGTSDLLVGAERVSSNDLLGDVAELLVYSRPLTDSEMHNLNKYFSHKYDLILFNENFIPRTFSLSTAINQNVNSDTFLRRQDGTPSDTTPYVVPFSCQMTSISASSDGNATWDAEFVRDGITRYTLSITATDSGYINATRTLNAGDKISMMAANISGSVNRPGITIWFEELP